MDGWIFLSAVCSGIAIAAVIAYFRIDALRKQHRKEIENWEWIYRNLKSEIKSLQNQNSHLDIEVHSLQASPTKTKTLKNAIDSLYDKVQHLNQCKQSLERENGELRQALKTRSKNIERIIEEKTAAMPWLAGMMADYMTYDIEMQAKYLDWGSDKKRLKKVDDIRAIRAEAKALIANAQVAEYQLEYLKQLYPALDDVLDTDYDELPNTAAIPEYDYTRDYLSKEEYSSLSDVERNQLALDRYVASHKKSKWQIGRDYEMAVAFEYRKKGYAVDSFCTYKGLEDLGRDIIAEKDGHTLIIQCKYWSHEKEIHEKHIFQLYGTTICYCIEHPLFDAAVPVFITNISLSPMARAVAEALNVHVVENHEMVDFPRIKCNIGRDDMGRPTKIYHLPMDMQYDSVQIKDAGEFYAFTVKEAVDAGFRRAYRWHGPVTAPLS